MTWQRVPSAKFAVNQLMLHSATLTYSLLRIFGEPTLGDDAVPLRKAGQRYRNRSTIRSVIICAAKLTRHARRAQARWSRRSPWGLVRTHLYASFA